MLTPLRNQLKTQIYSLTGFNFQNFISELYLLKFGNDKFIPLRDVKDKGCDGIIVDSRTILACYGPKKYEKNDFEDKIKKDFNLYRNNWEENYPCWQVIVNHPPSPDQIKFIDNLKQNSSFLGLEQLIKIIEEDLTKPNIRTIVEYLNISKDYIVQDYIAEILDDLLRGSYDVKGRVSYEQPTYIIEKIELNFLDKDLENFTNEYDIVSEYFSDIKGVLNSYDDDEINKLKVRVINDFSEFRGAFDKKLSLITKKYLEKYSTIENDDYRFYIRAILLYLFEQCLIGKKTKSEK